MKHHVIVMQIRKRSLNLCLSEEITKLIVPISHSYSGQLMEKVKIKTFIKSECISKSSFKLFICYHGLALELSPRNTISLNFSEFEFIYEYIHMPMIKQFVNRDSHCMHTKIKQYSHHFPYILE